MGVGKGGVHVYVKPGKGSFIYRYAASETQLQDSKTRAVFFLEKDLVPGNSMSLEFTKTDGDA
ncbi:hypothetical protein, partial [Salmonella sp. s57402]|uniref:hypothetical protein n=1 Tax=Salmonella sp. s57402 TaxID=3159695 RepID=UPI00398160ED